MKTKRMSFFGLTLILSLLFSLGFVSMPIKNLQANAADELNYNQYMLVEGVPQQTPLTQSAGTLVIDGQVVESGTDLSYKFILGQKDVSVSAIANQGLWCRRYADQLSGSRYLGQDA